ncbi:MAG: hypothetical protein WC188_04640 [Candidatus Caldatribacteriota bacterium]|nr:hypothetical protein [Patescibacteria group bacterium]
MATANKILGRVKPASITNTSLYTVPVVTQANVNIFIANQGSGEDQIRVAITPSGSALAATDYIIYDIALAGNSSQQLTGIALAASDFITVYSLNGTTSFVATGIEIS